MHQEEDCLAAFEMDFDELIGKAFACRRIGCNLREFLVEELDRFRPVDRLRNLREKKFDRLWKILTQNLLSRGVLFVWLLG
jgi:hypothetical protein